MATLTLECNRARHVLTWPTTHHPSGRIRIVLTPQHAGPSRKLPVKVCRRCRRGFSALAFLKMPVQRAGVVYLMDGAECFECDAPGLFHVHEQKGKLAMRLELRDVDGLEVSLWDATSKSLRPSTLFGLRRMLPGGNELRLQPRLGRHPL